MSERSLPIPVCVYFVVNNKATKPNMKINLAANKNKQKSKFTLLSSEGSVS
jgi:hypothetical protein